MSIDDAATRGNIMQRSLRASISEEDGIAIDIGFYPDYDKVFVHPMNSPPPVRVEQCAGDPTKRTVELTWRGDAVDIKVSRLYDCRDDEAEAELLKIAKYYATVAVSSLRRPDADGNVWAVFTMRPRMQTEADWMQDALPIVAVFCGFAVRENILRHRLSGMFPHASVCSSTTPDEFFLRSNADENRRICFRLRNSAYSVNCLLISPSPACGWRDETSMCAKNAGLKIEAHHGDFLVDADGIHTRFERLEDIAPALAAVNAIARPMLQVE